MPKGARKSGPHSSIHSNCLSWKSHFASQSPVSASAKMDKLKILPHRVIVGLYKSLTTGLSILCTAVSPLFSSVAQSCPTLCDSMDCSTPGLPVPHQLPEFTQTHVHRVGDAIQPSHPLSSPSPSTFNLSPHQGLFK